MSWWNRRSETVRDAVGAVPIVLLFVLVEQVSGDGGSVARAVVVVLVMGLACPGRARWVMRSVTPAVVALVAVAAVAPGKAPSSTETVTSPRGPA